MRFSIISFPNDWGCKAEMAARNTRLFGPGETISSCPARGGGTASACISNILSECVIWSLEQPTLQAAAKSAIRQGSKRKEMIRERNFGIGSERTRFQEFHSF